MQLHYTPLQWVILSAFLAALLPIAVGAARYRHLAPALRNVFWFCLISFTLDASGRVLWLFKVPNLFLGHVHTLLEFLLFANVYRLYFGRFLPARLLPIGMLAFTGLAIVNTLFLQDLQQNNSYIKLLEAALLIVLSMVFFYKLARELAVVRLERYPMFWINCAVLIYFASNVFVFLSSNYILLYSKELGIRIWFFHALFFMLFNAILTIGLWIAPKN